MTQYNTNDIDEQIKPLMAKEGRAKTWAGPTTAGISHAVAGEKEEDWPSGHTATAGSGAVFEQFSDGRSLRLVALWLGASIAIVLPALWWCVPLAAPAGAQLSAWRLYPSRVLDQVGALVATILLGTVCGACVVQHLMEHQAPVSLLATMAGVPTLDVLVGVVRQGRRNVGLAVIVLGPFILTLSAQLLSAALQNNISVWGVDVSSVSSQVILWAENGTMEGLSTIASVASSGVVLGGGLVDRAFMQAVGQPLENITDGVLTSSYMDVTGLSLSPCWLNTTLGPPDTSRCIKCQILIATGKNCTCPPSVTAVAAVCPSGVYSLPVSEVNKFNKGLLSAYATAAKPDGSAAVVFMNGGRQANTKLGQEYTFEVTGVANRQYVQITVQAGLIAAVTNTTAVTITAADAASHLPVSVANSGFIDSVLSPNGTVMWWQAAVISPFVPAQVVSLSGKEQRWVAAAMMSGEAVGWMALWGLIVVSGMLVCLRVNRTAVSIASGGTGVQALLADVKLLTGCLDRTFLDDPVRFGAVSSTHAALSSESTPFIPGERYGAEDDD
ncbi:hypothetical protein INT44_000286 [Umbelopsis vinacea]|uniref:Uncharacterized protein n=1 Tax=Umbelopsis vinacea TaxID=44442 RepID=A0A8H7UDD8_9FUNG|nr:hypothetical protein INT44_000286 [Umbelopsis vinacea]